MILLVFGFIGFIIITRPSSLEAVVFRLLLLVMTMIVG